MFGAAARLITVPLAAVIEQVAPQLMPTGVLLTEPVPVPARLTESVNRGTKVAVTEVAVLTVTVHVPVPAQEAPLHPVNTDPDVAAAVSVTLVPLMKLAEQVAPQLIPLGELVTVPEPAPALVTVSADCGAGENVAVTFTAEDVTEMEQVPVPVQAPLQPEKTDPGPTAVAVSVNEVPLLKLREQVAPQEIPAGELATDPEPVPARVTVTWYCATLNAAVTLVIAFIVTVQVPVPEQPPPLQPAKTDVPAVGVAVSVTTVPWR